MIDNTHPTFALKWEHADAVAAGVISDLEGYLDHRMKGLKDSDTNKAILAALLAYRGGRFQVRLMNIPKGQKEAVKAALDCLKGDVLLSYPNETYEVRPEFSFLRIGGKVRTIEATTTELETSYGAIYRDDTHSEVPFQDFRRLGYIRPSLVRIPAPHKHWSIFFDDAPPPSQNWSKVEDDTGPKHDMHEPLMNDIVVGAKLRGVNLVRYGENGFICHHPEQAAFYIDNTLTRKTGKVGFRPLLSFTDQYQRQDIRWGSKP
jgi:hypothetical protein